MSTSPQIALLLTGNELMTGDTVDSNSAMIAEHFLSQGFHVVYKVTVGDDLKVLIAEMQRLSEQFDVLLVNGGLGPTSDDLTAEALAMAMGVGLSEHPEALVHIKQWCQKRHYPLDEPNRKQAILPVGVSLIANPVGSAVGFACTLNKCRILCTPGVPLELKQMLQEGVQQELNTLFPNVGQPKRHRLRVFGMGEASLQKRITEAFPDWPAEIEIGYRASLPLLELKLKVIEQAHYPLLAEWYDKVSALLGDHIVTDDARSMAHVVKDLLLAQNKTLTCAESCTGGLIASSVTEVSGSSAVFETGYVTYSNAAKQRLLGVSSESLNTFGAVSEAVVREMLAGALADSGADLGVAVSGIAGPSGGTEDKPVGTVWLAWGSANNIKTHEFYFPGHRIYFQKIVAALALDLIRRELIGSEQEPVYFKERQYQKTT